MLQIDQTILDNIKSSGKDRTSSGNFNLLLNVWLRRTDPVPTYGEMGDALRDLNLLQDLQDDDIRRKYQKPLKFY